MRRKRFKDILEPGLNEIKLARYFTAAWKAHKVLIEGTEDGTFLVSDTHILAEVERDNLTLASRRVFPKLPSPGESFGFGQNGEFPNVKMESAVNKILCQPLTRLEMTGWVVSDWQGTARVFVAPDDSNIFIQEQLIDLLKSKKDSHPPHSFYFYGMGRLDPVVVTTVKGSFVMVLLPIRIEHPTHTIKRVS